MPADSAGFFVANKVKYYYIAGSSNGIINCG